MRPWTYAESLLGSGAEILERVAIHILDQRFGRCATSCQRRSRPPYSMPGTGTSSTSSSMHHFKELTEDEMARVPRHHSGLAAPRSRRQLRADTPAIQQKWLTPIAGQGFEPADTRLAQVNEALGKSAIFACPSFNRYHETRWGFGPTPHEAQELVAFAQAGTIVDRLNEFSPSDRWNGPTKRSLSDAVIDAVGAAPDAFLDQLPQFLGAKPEYQYAIIAGFKKLWDAWDGKQPRLPWDRIWPKLVDFFETLVTNEGFGKARPPMKSSTLAHAGLDSPGDCRIPQGRNPQRRQSLCAGAPAADTAACRHPPQQIGSTGGAPRRRRAQRRHQHGQRQGDRGAA